MSVTLGRGCRIDTVNDLPDSVRNWLVARYSEKPTNRYRFKPADDPDSVCVAIVSGSRFFDFLISHGLDVASTVDACHAAGWLIDSMIAFQTVTMTEGAAVNTGWQSNRTVFVSERVLDAVVGGQWGELLELAKRLKLGDKQRTSVQHVARGGGTYPIGDLVLEFDWNDPKDNAKSLTRVLNAKFGSHCWRFRLNRSMLVAEKLSRPLKSKANR